MLAHLVDEILCTPEQKYDFQNKIRCTHQVHALLGSRLIYFDDAGIVKTDFLTAIQLEKCGIEPGARIEPKFWTAKRRRTA